MYLITNINNTIPKFVYCFSYIFSFTLHMYFEGVYIIPVKKWQCCGHKYSNWAFSPLGSNIPCVIHSRLFIPSSLLVPLFCLFSTLGIRHFSPSTMSLERKLGTVRSCGEWCRPLGGWVKLVSLLTHLHTNHRLALPCLLLLWVVASGEGRSQSTSSKGYAKNKTVDALY